MTRMQAAAALCAGLWMSACGGRGTSPETATPTGDETGAVASVDIDEQVHYENMADMIRGQVPGLEVVERGNGDFELRVRGARPAPSMSSGAAGDSLGGSGFVMTAANTYTEPLVVIDGMPVSPGNNARALKGLLPSLVESITVHRDVSSTSVYGPRGAHGVVVIRTKR